MPTVSVNVFTLGPWQTNCYLVSVEAPAPNATSAATANRRLGWVIDAGMGPQGMIDALQKPSANSTRPQPNEGWTPEALILTHAHVDHIAGASQLVAAMGGKVPVWNHDAEAQWLLDPELNLSAFSGMPVTAPPHARSLRDGEELTLGPTRWRLLHVPGHSPGSIALWCPEARLVISGDALFAGSIGRTDFPGCSFDQLERSIREKLYTLPDDTTVYPGHGPTTTIGREKRSNPFVRA